MPFAGGRASERPREPFPTLGPATNGKANAVPSALKGLAILANLSSPLPVAGAFLEALSYVRSNTLPLVRARGAHCKTVAHKSKAAPMRCLLREGERPREPFPTLGPTTNGKAIALLSAKREAVLQCAPRARTQGRAMAKRFQKRRGHKPGERKVSDHHRSFSPAQGRAMAKHLAKRFQRRAGHRRGSRKACASSNLSLAKGKTTASPLAQPLCALRFSNQTLAFQKRIRYTIRETD